MKKISVLNKVLKVLFAFVLMIPFAVSAQTCTDTNDICCVDPSQCSIPQDPAYPIDDYAIYLAVAAFLIGVFMIIRARRNSINNA